MKKLKEAGENKKDIKACLDRIEEMQTKVIDFESYMNATHILFYT